MVLAGLLIVLACAASSPAFAQVAFGVGIRVGPPPPRYEVAVAAPFPHAVWVRGCWSWNAHAGRYAWIRGHWMHERPFHAWVDGGWHHGPRGWQWREGYWRRHEQHERGERWVGRHR